MTSPSEIATMAAQMRDWCVAHEIDCVIVATVGMGGPTLHLRLEDFGRAFASREVDVTAGSGFEHLRASAAGFDVIAVRPMPMALGPRVEVMP